MIRLKTRQLIFLVLVFLKILLSAAAAVVTLSAGTCSQTFWFCWCPLGCRHWLGSALRWDQDCSEGTSINCWLQTCIPTNQHKLLEAFPITLGISFSLKRQLFHSQKPPSKSDVLCATEADCVLVKTQKQSSNLVFDSSSPFLHNHYFGLIQNIES